MTIRASPALTATALAVEVVGEAEAIAGGEPPGTHVPAGPRTSKRASGVLDVPRQGPGDFAGEAGAAVAKNKPKVHVGAAVEASAARGGAEPFHVLNKTHSGSMPKPKGRGPSGGRLQSHHGLQDEWAKQNLPGYSSGKAPTITLETGKGLPHTKLSNLQRARRDARVAAGQGKWSSSLQEELGHTVSDLRSVGLSDATVRQVMEQTYKMLDKLGVSYSRVRF